MKPTYLNINHKKNIINSQTNTKTYLRHTFIAACVSDYFEFTFRGVEARYHSQSQVIK